MCSLSDGLFLRPLLGSFTASIFQHTLILLLLTDRCQCQETGPSQTVTASVGDDVLLPCHLEPAADVVSESLEWGRLDLEPRFVHVWHKGQNLLANQNPLYQGRTSLFVDKLKLGDLSLKLSAVRHSDNGLYRCYFPSQRKASTVKLVVGSAASAAIAGIHITSSGAVLQCESRGWYPEPELLWLDAEGNLLPSGPTETVPGPDGLYTVSGRATVEQRHSSSFTCRVRQSNTNQSRETHIQVAAECFAATSYSVVRVSIVLVVVLTLICAVALVVWKWRRNQNKEQREKVLEESKRMKEVKEQMINTLMEQKDQLKSLGDQVKCQKEEMEREMDGIEKKLQSVDKDTESDRAKGYLQLKGIMLEAKGQLQNIRQEHEQLFYNAQTLLIKTDTVINRMMNREDDTEKQREQVRDQLMETEQQRDGFQGQA